MKENKCILNTIFSQQDLKWAQNEIMELHRTDYKHIASFSNVLGMFVCLFVCWVSGCVGGYQLQFETVNGCMLYIFSLTHLRKCINFSKSSVTLEKKKNAYKRYIKQTNWPMSNVQLLQ